jgi:O-antigen/teichoic acid export membrane protein
MGIVRNQASRVAIISFLGVFIGALNSLFFFPYILGADRHGLVILILSIATVFSQFAHFGVPNTIIRFSPFLRGRKKFLYRLALQIPLISVVFFSLLFFLFGDWFFESYIDNNTLFNQYKYSLSPLVISLVFFEVMLSISRSELKTVFPSILRELFLRIMTLFCLCTFYCGWLDFPTFIISWLFIYFVNVVILTFYLVKSSNFKFEFGFPLFPDKLIAKKMQLYGLVTLLTSSATILVNRIDIIMLGYFLELENIAFYSVAFFMATLIHIPARSILQIVKPIIAKSWVEQDFKEISSLYKKSALIQMFFGIFLFIGIWMSLEDFLIYVPEKYRGIEWVFFYLGVAKLIDVSLGVNGAILATSEKYLFDLYTNIFLMIITVTTNIIFIPFYGITGAAIATTISIFIHNVIKLIAVYHFFKIHPFQLSSFKLLIIGLFTIFILNQISFDFISLIWLKVLMRSLVISLVYVVPVIYFNISKDLNEILQGNHLFRGKL